MTYSEKLQDPRWQRKRLEVFQRDDFTCLWCKDKDSPLHVHHLAYPKNSQPWDTDNAFLLTLCQDCHRELEDLLVTVRLIIYRPLIRGLIEGMIDSRHEIERLLFASDILAGKKDDLIRQHNS